MSTVTSSSAIDISYSQNFLTNKDLVSKIVSLAKIEPGTTVLEIGPGKGIITDQLIAAVGEQGRVVAVELDIALAKQLSLKYKAFTQVNIVNQDILSFDLHSLPQDYLVFANVPFQITAKVFDRLFSSTHKPKQAFLILQRSALIEKNKFNRPQPTFKYLLLDPWYEIKQIHKFYKSDFSPQPSVETSLFCFSLRDHPLAPIQKQNLYQDWLAFISYDRVGEGAWLKIITKQQIKELSTKTKLQQGRGLKSQSTNSLIESFFLISTLNPQFENKIQGSLKKLRALQARTQAINLAGGHHSAKSRRRSR